MPKPVNTNKTRMLPKTAWKKGDPSPNPKGRPKEGESWSAIIKEISDMPVEEIMSLVGQKNDLGRAFSAMPKGVAIKKLVVARILAALMFEPTSGLWKELMDRAEGKIKEEIGVDGDVIIRVVYDDIQK